MSRFFYAIDYQMLLFSFCVEIKCIPNKINTYFFVH